MKVDFKGILKGAWNSIFIKEQVEKVATERMEICKVCPHNSDKKKLTGYKSFRPDFHCTLCGCDLHLKTRCMSCECPVSKWSKQMEEKEEEEMTAKLEAK